MFVACDDIRVHLPDFVRRLYRENAGHSPNQLGLEREATGVGARVDRAAPTSSYCSLENRDELLCGHRTCWIKKGKKEKG